MMSPEIVEIGDDNKNSIGNKDEAGTRDVHVAVGKNDLDVVKWAIDHVVHPGTCIFLVHVVSPVAYIPKPVGRPFSSQSSKEQIEIYVNEENNKRRNILQKYIDLCTDAKVAVETMLIESNAVTKSILNLIPVVNITNLVMGTKRPEPPSTRYNRSSCSFRGLFSRILNTGEGKAEYVQKNAPECCEVNIVYVRKQKKSVPVPSGFASNHQEQKYIEQPDMRFRKIQLKIVKVLLCRLFIPQHSIVHNGYSFMSEKVAWEPMVIL